ncbi:hypothetical protein CYMTET_36988 [Cymbomonas tetramitiformis]|uniref:AB hydrolase-1 domain-containing protein n=1 Tax=Cymbomonas tetramitiformis TaxID=36881 RepID=A0AAE0CG59_9CHLO|nr:hypothetical protein CYMTET_36988 [Cymbomonas tetramitiformis]
MPILGFMALSTQSVGLICQAFRWVCRCCRGYGQGDTEVLRTPEAAFQGLEDYPFAPHYFDHNGMRLHYVDEGPEGAADVVVLIHGMPAYSFCYRKLIPVLVAEGHRVLALDFLGCGKSDKPADESVFTFDRHVSSIAALVAHVEITTPKVTLVIHDWGSMIGQAALPTLDGTLKRLVILNAFAGPGLFNYLGWMLFKVWQGLVRVLGHAIPVGPLNAADAGGPSKVSYGAEVAYDAPYPNGKYKGIMAVWPLLYNNKSGVLKQYRDALEWSKANLTVHILVAFGDEDLILNLDYAFPIFKQVYARAQSFERVAIPCAGHFPMEENCPAVESALIDFMRKT